MSDILSAYAAMQPDKIAVVDDRRGSGVVTLTYAELEAAANRLANVLIGLGVMPNTKVVWCGQNSIGVVRIVNAARKIGATAVPLNYRMSDEEAAFVTDHSDAVLVYVDAEFAPMFARIRPELPGVATYLGFDGAAPAGMLACDELVSTASSEPPAVPATTEAGATMIYTSGTTGKPKGAVRRGVADPVQMGAMLQFIGYTPDDIYLTTGPLYHSGPGGFMGVAIALGQTIVLQRKFDPEDWLRLVDT